MTNEFIPILEAMDLLQRKRILPINKGNPRLVDDHFVAALHLSIVSVQRGSLECPLCGEE